MTVTEYPRRADGTVIDKAAVRQKYDQERDKRLRPDGDDQYIRLTGEYSHYLEDPYTPRIERAPKTDHRTVVFIGGGISGLVTCARLKEAGVTDVRMIEKGGDFGGTWYWNRYPGAQCDTASLVYIPLLEETGYMPTEKYAYAPEILEHCHRIGKHYGLYDDVLFHTEATNIEWDGPRSQWIIRTNRGDELTAQFVILGIGVLHVAKLPGIPGIKDFTGHSFHTSRWDYDYTGGDYAGTLMHKLADKRVAIIGTGATAVQCIPHLSRACGELYVFQRTPSSVDVRDNEPIDPDWFAEVAATPGWQQRWVDNFAAYVTGTEAEEDLVKDGWTAIAARARARMAAIPRDELTLERLLTTWDNADFEKMDEIRSRVDAVIGDPQTASKLKAWYQQLCKRPCFHDEYLPSFNRPNTHLIDTNGKGVERITETGIVVGGREYEVDCIIYSSGFEVGTTYTRRAGFDVIGRDGARLSELWADGMRTMHGIHVYGFPNAFIVQYNQGAMTIFNFAHDSIESGRTVATILKHGLENGCTEIEVTKQAQDAWVETLLSGDRLHPQGCTPGYYNSEGRPGAYARLRRGYPWGAAAYFDYLKRWRTSGEFNGLEFR
jgi:cation diffusion facilitator CzcD-associated flavoprotein CzcO